MIDLFHEDAFELFGVVLKEVLMNNQYTIILSNLCGNDHIACSVNVGFPTVCVYLKGLIEKDESKDQLVLLLDTILSSCNWNIEYGDTNFKLHESLKLAIILSSLWSIRWNFVFFPSLLGIDEILFQQLPTRMAKYPSSEAFLTDRGYSRDSWHLSNFSRHYTPSFINDSDQFGAEELS